MSVIGESPDSEEKAEASGPGTDLAPLRGEIDRLDEAIHDALIARAGLVEQLAALRVKGQVAVRAGREAAILHRLLKRRKGPLPAGAVIRIWREIFAAMTALQGPFLIAACDEAGSEVASLAREQYGVLTPLRLHATPAQTLAELVAGAVTLAALAWPAETLPTLWWPALLRPSQPRIHVIARLPYWPVRAEGAARGGALVLATVPPDPSGADRSLIGIEIAPELSRARLTKSLAASGFSPGPLAVYRDPNGGEAMILVDCEGFVTEDDPRLSAFPIALRPPVVIGAYALAPEVGP